MHHLSQHKGSTPIQPVNNLLNLEYTCCRADLNKTKQNLHNHFEGQGSNSEFSPLWNWRLEYGGHDPGLHSVSFLFPGRQSLDQGYLPLAMGVGTGPCQPTREAFSCTVLIESLSVLPTWLISSLQTLLDSGANISGGSN